MQRKREALRLVLLLLPALALAISAWVYLLLGPGSAQDAGFDVGTVALCLLGQTLAFGWAVVCASLYVCSELKATLLTRRFFDLSRLRDKLAGHRIYLEVRGPLPIPAAAVVAAQETQVPALDKAIQDYELVLGSGKTMGRREVAMSVLNRVSRAGALGRLKKEQATLLLSELCLTCGEHLAIGQRDSETLEVRAQRVPLHRFFLSSI